MSRKKTMNVSERVRIILGDDATLYPDALDSWARCLQETMVRLEKVFTEEEWQSLGRVAVEQRLTSNVSTVPFGVVLVHCLLDQQTITLESERHDMIEKLIVKLKKLDAIQSSALRHTLESYILNPGELRQHKWWQISERIKRLQKKSESKRAA